MSHGEQRLGTSSHGEAAVRQSDERFRQMADTIPEVIRITSLEPERVLYSGTLSS